MLRPRPPPNVRAMPLAAMPHSLAICSKTNLDFYGILNTLPIRAKRSRQPRVVAGCLLAGCILDWVGICFDGYGRCGERRGLEVEKTYALFQRLWIGRHGALLRADVGRDVDADDIFSLFAATRGKQGHKGEEGGEDVMTIFHGYSARRICTDILHVRFFSGKVTKIPLYSNILKNKTTHGV